jgi:hypothetical protein
MQAICLWRFFLQHHNPWETTNDAMIVQKTKFLILFTSQINFEWFKASPVDMDLFYKEKRINSFLEVIFDVLAAAQMTWKKCLKQHNIFSKDPLKKIIIVLQSKYILAPSKKKFKKSQWKYHNRSLPKLPIVPCRDFVPLGIKEEYFIKFKIYFSSLFELIC